MEYKVLIAEGEDEVEETLEKMVKKQIQKGWKPIGGVSIAVTRVGYSDWYHLAQAMIKE